MKEQPSPLLVLWSSHVSPPRSSPSPQSGTQWLGMPSGPPARSGGGPHPSPLLGLPSSHVSLTQAPVAADKRARSAGRRSCNPVPSGIRSSIHRRRPRCRRRSPRPFRRCRSRSLGCRRSATTCRYTRSRRHTERSSRRHWWCRHRRSPRPHRRRRCRTSAYRHSASPCSSIPPPRRRRWSSRRRRPGCHRRKARGPGRCRRRRSRTSVAPVPSSDRSQSREDHRPRSGSGAAADCAVGHGQPALRGRVARRERRWITPAQRADRSRDEVAARARDLSLGVGWRSSRCRHVASKRCGARDHAGLQSDLLARGTRVSARRCTCC